MSSNVKTFEDDQIFAFAAYCDLEGLSREESELLAERLGGELTATAEEERGRIDGEVPVSERIVAEQIDSRQALRWVRSADMQLQFGSKSGHPPTWDQIKAAKECLERAEGSLGVQRD